MMSFARACVSIVVGVAFKLHFIHLRHFTLLDLLNVALKLRYSIVLSVRILPHGTVSHIAPPMDEVQLRNGLKSHVVASLLSSKRDIVSFQFVGLEVLLNSAVLLHEAVLRE